MTPVEHQVRGLMRAWPIPDRVERENEIVTTTLELIPEGGSRLPPSLAVDLVVGGLRARWRMRPPPWRWINYRMGMISISGGRLPTRWHRWMINDLTGPGWRRRMVMNELIYFVSYGLIFVGIPTVFNPHYLVLPAVIGWSVVTIPMFTIRAALAPKRRNRQLDRYGYLRPAQHVPSGPPPPISVQPVGFPDRHDGGQKVESHPSVFPPWPAPHRGEIAPGWWVGSDGTWNAPTRTGTSPTSRR